MRMLSLLMGAVCQITVAAIPVSFIAPDNGYSVLSLEVIRSPYSEVGCTFPSFEEAGWQVRECTGAPIVCHPMQEGYGLKITLAVEAGTLLHAEFTGRLTEGGALHGGQYIQGRP